MTRLSIPLSSLLLALAAWPAAAADVCNPVKLLPASTHVKFSADSVDLLPKLRLTAGSGVVLAGSPKDFGLDNTTRERKVSDGFVLRQQKVESRFLGSERALLQFQQLTKTPTQVSERNPSGSTYVEADGHRYLLRVAQGDAHDDYGNALKLMPVLAATSTFSVDRGATVRLTDASHVQIDAGAQFEWSPALAPGGLEAELQNPVYLRQQAPRDSAAQAEIMKTSRAFSGGTIKVKVTARGYDFGKDPIAFCFEDPDPGYADSHGPLATPAARILDRTTDSATYQVALPPGLEGKLAPAEGAFQGTFYRPAQVRVLGFAGGDLAFEATQAFQLSNSLNILIASLATVVIAFGLGSMLSKEKGWKTIAQNLLRRGDGAYSLSNLQILMWTLLVVFALCYVWAGSDQLVELSPGILVLLGISGGASVLARQGDKPVLQDAKTVNEPHYADFVNDEDDRFDLLRFQMLAFTVFTWIYALGAVLRTQGFPEIPENLYMLMGISNAAYIGGKFMGGKNADAAKAAAPATAGETLELSDAEKALGPDKIGELQRKLGIPVTGKIDAATRDAVVQRKRKDGISPANGRINDLLIASL